MLFFILNISYTSVPNLRRCIATDLSSSESSEKADEKSLHTKLSALLCILLMRLTKCSFIQTVDVVIGCSTEVHPN